MPKLSPSYQEDNESGLPDEVKKYLDTHFLANLPNKTRPNPKVLVVFSGGNAVGKTTLAARIQKELGAVVLENDAVKRWLMAYDPHLSAKKRSVWTWQYTMNLYQRLSKEVKNGLIVRDGVIDWYFDRILPKFEQQGYKLFIVGYDLSREKRRELIVARGDTPTVSTSVLLGLFNDHDIHMKRFRDVYTPDVLLSDDTIFDHEKVIRLLKKILRDTNDA